MNKLIKNTSSCIKILSNLLKLLKTLLKNLTLTFIRLPQPTICYMPYGITQCYLPPDRGNTHTLTPRQLKLVFELATLEGCQNKLTYLAGYIVRWHTCPKVVTHPRTNRARRKITLLTQSTTIIPNHRPRCGHLFLDV